MMRLNEHKIGKEEGRKDKRRSKGKRVEKRDGWQSEKRRKVE